jgi:hypothetical protein
MRGSHHGPWVLQDEYISRIRDFLERISESGDEVFTAAADSIRERLEQFGVHVTLEIEPGLYHAYAVMPLVKDAMPGYKRMKEYISK